MYKHKKKKKSKITYENEFINNFLLNMYKVVMTRLICNHFASCLKHDYVTIYIIFN